MDVKTKSGLRATTYQTQQIMWLQSTAGLILHTEATRVIASIPPVHCLGAHEMLEFKFTIQDALKRKALTRLQQSFQGVYPYPGIEECIKAWELGSTSLPLRCTKLKTTFHGS